MGVVSLDRYQFLAARTANPGLNRDRFANSGMGLAGEAGEVCDYLKKVVFHKHQLDTEKLKDELGDVLWYVADLATAAGLNLSDIATANIEKLQKRYPNGFDSERSINREG